MGGRCERGMPGRRRKWVVSAMPVNMLACGRAMRLDSGVTDREVGGGHGGINGDGEDVVSLEWREDVNTVCVEMCSGNGGFVMLVVSRSVGALTW